MKYRKHEARDDAREVRKGIWTASTYNFIACGVHAVRAIHARWITGYGAGDSRLPYHEQKIWMAMIGMRGGGARPPGIRMTAEAEQDLRADLEAAGLPPKARASAPAESERRAA